MPHRRRHVVRREMAHLVDRLIAEYAGAVPAGSVMRCVARTHAELRQAGIRGNIVAATEQVVRGRLSARIPAHGAA